MPIDARKTRYRGSVSGRWVAAFANGGTSCFALLGNVKLVLRARDGRGHANPSGERNRSAGASPSLGEKQGFESPRERQ